MGRPIITTDAIGCRQLASRGNGFICKVRDSESLSNSMMKMLESPIGTLRDMGLISREMVELQYSEEIVVSSYIAAIEERSQNAMARS